MTHFNPRRRRLSAVHTAHRDRKCPVHHSSECTSNLSLPPVPLCLPACLPDCCPRHTIAQLNCDSRQTFHPSATQNSRSFLVHGARCKEMQNVPVIDCSNQLLAPLPLSINVPVSQHLNIISLPTFCPQPAPTSFSSPTPFLFPPVFFQSFDHQHHQPAATYFCLSTCLHNDRFESNALHTRPFRMST